MTEKNALGEHTGAMRDGRTMKWAEVKDIDPILLRISGLVSAQGMRSTDHQTEGFVVVDGAHLFRSGLVRTEPMYNASLLLTRSKSKRNILLNRIADATQQA